MRYLSIHSPVGEITLFEDAEALVALESGWVEGEQSAPTPLLIETIRQQAVLQIVQEIPYGKTRTYKDISSQLNTGPRPVGNACGRNPIPIIIPCHRVQGTSTLGGYSGPGGVEIKQHLLRLEGIAFRDFSRR